MEWSLAFGTADRLLFAVPNVTTGPSTIGVPSVTYTARVRDVRKTGGSGSRMSSRDVRSWSSVTWQLLMWACTSVVVRTTSAMTFTMLPSTSAVSSTYIIIIIIIVICPIAIAYSMGQIIKSFCVCACVCLSVRGHSHGRISSSIFTKLDTDV